MAKKEWRPKTPLDIKEEVAYSDGYWGKPNEYKDDYYYTESYNIGRAKREDEKNRSPFFRPATTNISGDLSWHSVVGLIQAAIFCFIWYRGNLFLAIIISAGLYYAVFEYLYKKIKD